MKKPAQPNTELGFQGAAGTGGAIAPLPVPASVPPSPGLGSGPGQHTGSEGITPTATPGPVGDTIDAEEQDEGFDSGADFGSLTSSTTSLSSSITHYRYENGRRYHAYKDGAYWGPNDEQAADHLDIANHLYLLTLKNKLYLAPISANPQRVLDVGTGTGIWAVDFADQHPSAEVIGTDLSPIQPSWTPANCKFEIDDVEEEWTFQKNSFDFIHIRSLFGCVADWPKLYREALKHLKPGGYIEQIEMAPGFKSDDGSLNPDSAYGRWHDLGVQCGRLMGKSFETMYHMKDFITAAGFEDVHEVTYKWPIGPWMEDKEDKELGMWTRLHIGQGLENWSMAANTRLLGWTREQVHAHVALVRRDLKNKNIHGYHEMRVVYARKPTDWEP